MILLNSDKRPRSVCGQTIELVLLLSPVQANFWHWSNVFWEDFVRGLHLWYDCISKTAPFAAILLGTSAAASRTYL